ncbi:hypothetical protein ACHHYP_05963 [Achlya hypogyna]|uniref:MULE transposase domain-containing protein n=1 Tax=Achlya hypogyna TaxID=1202772 RepID=A0A1V9ZNE0_ACHHY|nr:hypothetical protein ACHHYP_05963 [Achlya hypogyna]
MTPTQIRSKLLASKCSPVPSQRQVTYCARAAIAATYRNDSDPFVSSQKLIGDSNELEGGQVTPPGLDGGVKATYVAFPGLISALANLANSTDLSNTTEVIIDSTFNTIGSTRGTANGDNPRFEVFALMTNYRGEGYPISYMMIQAAGWFEHQKSLQVLLGTKDVKIAYITAWLKCIANKYRLSPTWVHLDKDASLALSEDITVHVAH